MPRFFMRRDGHDHGYFQVLSENPVEFFARSIQRTDAPGLPVEQIQDGIVVYRFAKSHECAGQVSRLEWHPAGTRLWIATREPTLGELARREAGVL